MLSGTNGVLNFANYRFRWVVIQWSSDKLEVGYAMLYPVSVRLVGGLLFFSSALRYLCIFLLVILIDFLLLLYVLRWNVLII